VDLGRSVHVPPLQARLWRRSASAEYATVGERRMGGRVAEHEIAEAATEAYSTGA